MRMVMYLGVLALLVGCDGSKVELESAKTNLANVTRERDDLTTQVATLQQQLSSAKADLAKEKTAEAEAAERNAKPPIASKSGSRDSSAAPKNKRTHKS